MRCVDFVIFVKLDGKENVGLSFGERRPFTPTEANNATLSVPSVNKKSFNIYPNPASDFIQIQSPENIIETNIYSSLGQKVMTSQEKKINIKSLNAGVYWAEIKTKNGSTVHKVVKK